VILADVFDAILAVNHSGKGARPKPYPRPKRRTQREMPAERINEELARIRRMAAERRARRQEVVTDG
jgi:hypothetical protein